MTEKKDDEKKAAEKEAELNINWEALKVEYANTNISAAEMAEKYGISAYNLTARITRHKWVLERTRVQQAQAAQLSEEYEKKRASELQVFNADDLKIARAIRNRVAKALNVTSLNKKTGEMELANISASELRALAGAAETAQKIGRLALGASTGNVGIAGEGGEGPVQMSAVTMEDYLKAREEVLKDF
jgi:hypothetical protein